MENLKFLDQYRNPKTGRLKHGTLKLLTPEQKLQYTSAYSAEYYRNRKRKTLGKPLRKYDKYKTTEYPSSDYPSSDNPSSDYPCPTCETENCIFVPN